MGKVVVPKRPSGGIDFYGNPDAAAALANLRTNPALAKIYADKAGYSLEEIENEGGVPETILDNPVETLQEDIPISPGGVTPEEAPPGPTGFQGGFQQFTEAPQENYTTVPGDDLDAADTTTQDAFSSVDPGAEEIFRKANAQAYGDNWVPPTGDPYQEHPFENLEQFDNAAESTIRRRTPEELNVIYQQLRKKPWFHREALETYAPDISQFFETGADFSEEGRIKPSEIFTKVEGRDWDDIYRKYDEALNMHESAKREQGYKEQRADPGVTSAIPRRAMPGATPVLAEEPAGTKGHAFPHSATENPGVKRGHGRPISEVQFDESVRTLRPATTADFLGDAGDINTPFVLPGTDTTPLIDENAADREGNLITPREQLEAAIETYEHEKSGSIPGVNQLTVKPYEGPNEIAGDWKRAFDKLDIPTRNLWDINFFNAIKNVQTVLHRHMQDAIHSGKDIRKEFEEQYGTYDPDILGQVLVMASSSLVFMANSERDYTLYKLQLESANRKLPGGAVATPPDTLEKSGLTVGAAIGRLDESMRKMLKANAKADDVETVAPTSFMLNVLIDAQLFSTSRTKNSDMQVLKRPGAGKIYDTLQQIFNATSKYRYKEGGKYVALRTSKTPPVVPEGERLPHYVGPAKAHKGRAEKLKGSVESTIAEQNVALNRTLSSKRLYAHTVMTESLYNDMVNVDAWMDSFDTQAGWQSSSPHFGGAPEFRSLEDIDAELDQLSNDIFYYDEYKSRVQQEINNSVADADDVFSIPPTVNSLEELIDRQSELLAIRQIASGEIVKHPNATPEGFDWTNPRHKAAFILLGKDINNNEVIQALVEKYTLEKELTVAEAILEEAEYQRELIANEPRYAKKNRDVFRAINHLDLEGKGLNGLRVARSDVIRKEANLGKGGYQDILVGTELEEIQLAAQENPYIYAAWVRSILNGLLAASIDGKPRFNQYGVNPTNGRQHISGGEFNTQGSLIARVITVSQAEIVGDALPQEVLEKFNDTSKGDKRLVTAKEWELFQGWMDGGKDGDISPPGPNQRRIARFLSMAYNSVNKSHYYTPEDTLKAFTANHVRDMANDYLALLSIMSPDTYLGRIQENKSLFNPNLPKVQRALEVKGLDTQSLSPDQIQQEYADLLMDGAREPTNARTENSLLFPGWDNKTAGIDFFALEAASNLIDSLPSRGTGWKHYLASEMDMISAGRNMNAIHVSQIEVIERGLYTRSKEGVLLDKGNARTHGMDVILSKFSGDGKVDGISMEAKHRIAKVLGKFQETRDSAALDDERIAKDIQNPVIQDLEVGAAKAKLGRVAAFDSVIFKTPLMIVDYGANIRDQSAHVRKITSDIQKAVRENNGVHEKSKIDVTDIYDEIEEVYAEHGGWDGFISEMNDAVVVTLQEDLVDGYANRAMKLGSELLAHVGLNPEGVGASGERTNFGGVDWVYDAEKTHFIQGTNSEGQKVTRPIITAIRGKNPEAPGTLKTSGQAVIIKDEEAAKAMGIVDGERVLLGAVIAVIDDKTKTFRKDPDDSKKDLKADNIKDIDPVFFKDGVTPKKLTEYALRNPNIIEVRPFEIYSPGTGTRAKMGMGAAIGQGDETHIFTYGNAWLSQKAPWLEGEVNSQFGYTFDNGKFDPLAAALWEHHGMSFTTQVAAQNTRADIFKTDLNRGEKKLNEIARYGDISIGIGGNFSIIIKRLDEQAEMLQKTAEEIRQLLSTGESADKEMAEIMMSAQGYRSGIRRLEDAYSEWKLWAPVEDLRLPHIHPIDGHQNPILRSRGARDATFRTTGSIIASYIRKSFVSPMEDQVEIRNTKMKLKQIFEYNDNFRKKDILYAANTNRSGFLKPGKE